MTCRILPAIGLLVLALLLATMPADVQGCGGAYPPGQRADVADETALVIWDEAAKTEHLIRRATFVGSAYDFGFLVPTPNRPFQIEEASPDLFDELARITEPKTEQQTVTEFTFGCSRTASSAKPVEEPEQLAGGVVVLEQKRLGDMEVLLFRADKSDKPEDAAESLLGWLNRKGYAVRPNLSAWLVPYIQNHWIITAFKIAGQPNGEKKAENPKGIGLKTVAVRMSFKTDHPFFPYREPDDQRDEIARNTPRLLRLYVAAKYRMAGKIGETTAWPGQTAWANTVTDTERRSVLEKAGKLPFATGPGSWWLTEFEDRSTPRPGTDELYFEVSGEQSSIAREPRIITTYKTPWWVGPILIGVPLVAIIGGILFWRQSRLPEKKGPLPFP